MPRSFVGSICSETKTLYISSSSFSVFFREELLRIILSKHFRLKFEKSSIRFLHRFIVSEEEMLYILCKISNYPYTITEMYENNI